MGERKLDSYSIDEYIELERSTGQKYDYFNGWLEPRAGGTLNHATICTNISTELKIAVKGKSCRAFNSEVKIFIDKANAFVYPDAAVVCGGIATHFKEKNAITNPILIVEVLSDSTLKNDRGNKFLRYRTLDSFQEYVLIRQDASIVEVFCRREDGQWNFSTYLGLEAVVRLASIEVDIAMKAIYEDVTGLKSPQHVLSLS